MISALRKIDGRSDIPSAPSAVQEMMLDNPEGGFGWLFATHPSIESRVEALVRFAGGRADLPNPAIMPETAAPLAGTDPKLLGPWGRRV
jgi:heat shock protein HtpX